MVKFIEEKHEFLLDLSPREKEYPVAKERLGRAADYNLTYMVAPHDLVFKNVSELILHLTTTRGISEEYAVKLGEFIKTHAPENQIDWDSTYKALRVYQEYTELVKPTLPKKGEGLLQNILERSDNRKTIVTSLKAKYNL